MWSDPKAINRLALVLAVIAMATLAWCALSWASAKHYFAITQVRVITASAEVDTGILEAAIRSDLRGTFFTLSPARESLGALEHADKLSALRHAATEFSQREHFHQLPSGSPKTSLPPNVPCGHQSA